MNERMTTEQIEQARTEAYERGQEEAYQRGQEEAYQRGQEEGFQRGQMEAIDPQSIIEKMEKDIKGREAHLGAFKADREGK